MVQVASSGDVERMRLMVEGGADPNTRSARTGCCPLGLAAARKDPTMVPAYM